MAVALAAPASVVLGSALVLLVGFRRWPSVAPANRSSRAGCSSRRLLNTTNLVSLTVGAMLVGLTSYVPLYVQGVLGTTLWSAASPWLR